MRSCGPPVSRPIHPPSAPSPSSLVVFACFGAWRRHIEHAHSTTVERVALRRCGALLDPRSGELFHLFCSSQGPFLSLFALLPPNLSPSLVFVPQSSPLPALWHPPLVLNAIPFRQHARTRTTDRHLFPQDGEATQQVEWRDRCHRRRDSREGGEEREHPRCR